MMAAPLEMAPCRSSTSPAWGIRVSRKNQKHKGSLHPSALSYAAGMAKAKHDVLKKNQHLQCGMFDILKQANVINYAQYEYSSNEVGSSSQMLEPTELKLDIWRNMRDEPHPLPECDAYCWVPLP